MKFRLGAVSLQVSLRQVGDVTILDLRGRSTIGSDTELLRSHLQALVANRVHIIPSFEDEAQALASFQTRGYSAKP